MGWKTFKEHFNIKHNVSVSDNILFIGSDLVKNLVEIDMKTGLFRSTHFQKDLFKKYPELFKCGPEFLLELFNKVDYFEKCLTVYTFDGINIIEKKCEEYGFPNVTHDGTIMYDNEFFSNKDDVINAINTNLTCSIDRLIKYQEIKSNELNEINEELEKCKADLRSFGLSLINS